MLQLVPYITYDNLAEKSPQGYIEAFSSKTVQRLIQQSGRWDRSKHLWSFLQSVSTVDAIQTQPALKNTEGQHAIRKVGTSL